MFEHLGIESPITFSILSHIPIEVTYHDTGTKRLVRKPSYRAKISLKRSVTNVFRSSYANFTKLILEHPLAIIIAILKY
ncbi:MAG: hypothetical protein SPLUMA2_SPLUMAMAG2_00001 [uncultured Sulfurimonas sp.]|nr:MAG: hypothetical protein SPLUMA2_SPLUMAMAG2_00001 [uncultured Sulfurimonas sp.]